MADWTDALEVNGRRRCFHYHVPSEPVGEPRPLLIALHGRNLRIEEMRRITHLDEVADTHGFGVIYPEGYQRSWNDGRGNTRAELDGVDDVAFIRRLIDHLGRLHEIDSSRVGVTGLSNGGVMCHRLALELGDRIAAIAPVAGLMPVALADVVPEYAVSALLIQGDRDQFMPIQGGQAHGKARLLLFMGGVRIPAGPVLSLAETVARWRAVDRCRLDAVRDDLPAREGDPTSVERVSYGGGHGGTAVEERVIRGGGHTWPGGPTSMGLGLLGRTTTRFDAGEEICRFMAGQWQLASERRLSENRVS